ncbi:hypothetical protein HY993_00875 [Candidatus Micrarchaeota archaeon]|nr:hypothetical protein [Candidatus Micrarchaeota archaeon]
MGESKFSYETALAAPIFKNADLSALASPLALVLSVALTVSLVVLLLV